MPGFGKTLALTLFFFLFTLSAVEGPVSAQNLTTPSIYEITSGIPSQSITQGFSFLTKNFDINYTGEEKVILSANPDGTGSTLVDDKITINFVAANGTFLRGFTHTYTTNCNPLVQLPPQDITNFFEPGINRLRITLRDVCGAYKFSSPLYLVFHKDPTPTPTPTPTPSPPTLGPEPFLDLPWDYGANGMSFNDAAMSITSYFDHEYPLLSAGLDLAEPAMALGDLVNFFGEKDSKLPYSKHDGYDYARKAKVNFQDPVKAAAKGKAYFKSFFPGTFSRCGACGNMIVIDHENGYMTRYLHLDDSGLLLVNKDNPGPAQVTTGQVIGYVGHTGRTDPSDERGAHIHFDVIQDKNNDGNFEDNIPDGLVDPFGWQSEAPDPWETYSFNYAGQQRTGNKSSYLFTKKLDNLNASLTSNAAVFNIGKTKLEFPQGTTNQNLNLTANSAPNFTGNLLNSLGSILKVEAKNSAGQLISTFLKNFNLTIDFSQFDLNRYNLNTLSIYSSPDGQNWVKEPTQIINNTATTSINHLTYFALMAERKDTIAPTTTPILSGTTGTENNFRSDVTLSLNTEDNPNGLGVEFTAWGYEDQPWQTYSTLLSFTEEGTYKIFFYSQDKDDNIEEIKSVEFLIDKTPPVITAKATIEGNEYLPHTWTNKDVSVNFSCTDNLSGVSEITQSTTITTEGNNQEITGSCTDKAGNTSETSSKGINIDKTTPIIKLSATPDILWPPNNKMVEVKLNGQIIDTNPNLKTFNITDEYALIEPEISDFNQIIKLESGRKGNDLDGRVYTIIVTAEDLAGNNSEAQVQVIVPHDKDDKKLLDSRF